MLTYTQRENDILVRFKRRPLGVIEKAGRMHVYIPRACDRAIRWEFSSIEEVKAFLTEPSRISLTRY